MYKVLHATEQNIDAQVAYRNQMMCTYVLHKQHVNFFGAHSRIFFLNNVEDTIFFNSVHKMSHIFGPKLYVVSELCMTVSILLPCSAVPFLKLHWLSILGNISLNISGAMLYLL